MSDPKLWTRNEWVLERIERARKLAASSDQHRGTDLKYFLMDMDDTKALHDIMLTQEPTELQEQQGLVLFLRSAMHKLLQPFNISLLDGACVTALGDAVGHALLTEVPALELLAKLVAAALRIICQNKLSALPAVIQLRHLTVEDWSSDTAAAAEQLEEYQRSNSFKPLLTASDLKVTALLLRLHAADLQQSASAPGSAPAGANRRHEGLAAARQLQALMPDNPAVLLLRAALLSEAPNEAAAAAAAYGKALSAAQANQAHSVVATAAPNLAIMLALGACGNWSLAEVRRLLQDAKAAAALCKPWLAKPGLEFLRSQLAEAQQLVDLADTLSPGQDRKPPITATAAGWEPMSRTAKLPQCSGCGQTSLQLRKCSGCKVAAYCSRDCQVKHWRAGHKRECSCLAAAK